MKIENLLQKKGDAVITIALEAKVSEAAEMLAARRIGAVIVAGPDGVPRGILSERDIVRGLGLHGAATLGQPVSALMTENVIFCAPSDSLIDVLTKMTDGRFRHMPVMSDGRMVGLVSIGDVVAARLGELKMERDALEGMVMGH